MGKSLADDILENMVEITKMHAGKLIAEGKVERLEREKAELLAALRDLVSDIKKYHGDFDARLFVTAERIIAKVAGAAI